MNSSEGRWLVVVREEIRRAPRKTQVLSGAGLVGVAEEGRQGRREVGGDEVASMEEESWRRRREELKTRRFTTTIVTTTSGEVMKLWRKAKKSV